jgi:hypothetical protein
MNRTQPFFAAVLGLAVAACGPSPVDQGANPAGSLSLRFAALSGPSLAPPADEVVLELTGVHDTTVVGFPGDTVQILDLEVGEYQLKVQGYVDPFIVWTANRQVVVLPGTLSEPTIEPIPFEVSDLSTTSTLPLTGGAALDLMWTGVASAPDYRVAWSTAVDFAVIIRDTVVVGTSASIELGAAGTYYVRVSPRDSTGVLGYPAVLPDPVDVTN